MKERKEITKMLSELLIKERLTGFGKHWASEVSLDFGKKDISKRVDFLLFEPEDQISVAGIERGTFTFFEIKSCMEDFHSGHGLTFDGDKNYLVMLNEVYRANKEEIDQFTRNGIGLITAIQKDEKEYTLQMVRPSRKGFGTRRTRSAAELLFCMVRANTPKTKNEISDI